MTKLALQLAACVTLGAWTPCSAQSAVGDQERLAVLPTDDELSLQCAIWAAHLAYLFRGKEEEQAFNQAFSYFVGRYEGLSGRDIDQAVDEAFLIEATQRADFVTPVCAPMMRGHDERLVKWSTALEAPGAKARETQSAFDRAHPRIVPIDPNPVP